MISTNINKFHNFLCLFEVKSNWCKVGPKWPGRPAYPCHVWPSNFVESSLSPRLSHYKMGFVQFMS